MEYVYAETPLLQAFGVASQRLLDDVPKKRRAPLACPEGRAFQHARQLLPDRLLPLLIRRGYTPGWRKLKFNRRLVLPGHLPPGWLKLPKLSNAESCPHPPNATVYYVPATSCVEKNDIYRKLFRRNPRRFAFGAVYRTVLAGSVLSLPNSSVNKGKSRFDSCLILVPLFGGDIIGNHTDGGQHK